MRWVFFVLLYAASHTFSAHIVNSISYTKRKCFFTWLLKKHDVRVNKPPSAQSSITHKINNNHNKSIAAFDCVYFSYGDDDDEYLLVLSISVQLACKLHRLLLLRTQSLQKMHI